MSMIREHIHLSVNDERSADFVIVAEGKEVLTHRAVLMSQSPFLYTFLDQDPTCTRINANNAKYDSMMIALKAIYSLYNRQIRRTTPPVAGEGSGNNLTPFFASSRYDFSVLLSVWEISMHFKLAAVATAVVPMILPLLSRYTSVRALRSCLKHPNDDGALLIKTDSLRLIPPLLDTADQREEWNSLLAKYPYLTPLKEARERSRSPSMGRHNNTSNPQLHNSDVVDGGRRSTSRGRDIEFDRQASRHNVNYEEDVSDQHNNNQQHQHRYTSNDNNNNTVNRFAFENDSEEEQRRRGRSNSVGSRSHTHMVSPQPTEEERPYIPINAPAPPPTSHYHVGDPYQQHSSPQPHTHVAPPHSNYTNNHPSPSTAATPHQHQPRAAPIAKKNTASIEAKRRRVQQLKVELEGLRNEYHDGLTQWRDEEESLKGVAANIDEQDSDVRQLLKELEQRLEKNREQRVSVEEAQADMDAQLKAISDNEQYIISAKLYVPAAKDAHNLLSRHLDSQILQRGNGERVDALQHLLAELKSDKRAAATQLHDEQRLRQSLDHMVQMEKEKTLALRRKLTSMQASSQHPMDNNGSTFDTSGYTSSTRHR